MKTLKNGTYFVTIYTIVNEDDFGIEDFESFTEAKEWIREQVLNGDDLCYGIVKNRQMRRRNKYGYYDVINLKVIK